MSGVPPVINFIDFWAYFSIYVGMLPNIDTVNHGCRKAKKVEKHYLRSLNLKENHKGKLEFFLFCIFLQVCDETNLASSSIAETGDPNDLLGVIVSYSVKVKIVLSGMGGDLEVDMPFKLVHPRPGNPPPVNVIKS